MERYESRLQHLGPPVSPIASSDRAVILWDSANGSKDKGVVLEMWAGSQNLRDIPDGIWKSACQRMEVLCLFPLA